MVKLRASRLHIDGSGSRVMNGIDLALDVLGGSRCLVGQSLDFRRNYRKSPACFAGTSRLDCRVQGQKIRLMRNFLDRYDHAIDLTHGAVESFDGTVRGFRVPRSAIPERVGQFSR